MNCRIHTISRVASMLVVCLLAGREQLQAAKPFEVKVRAFDLKNAALVDADVVQVNVSEINDQDETIFVRGRQLIGTTESDTSGALVLFTRKGNEITVSIDPDAIASKLVTIDFFRPNQANIFLRTESLSRLYVDEPQKQPLAVKLAIPLPEDTLEYRQKYADCGTIYCYPRHRLGIFNRRWR
jgi:hypothetical protein